MSQMQPSPDPNSAPALVHQGWNQLQLQRPLAAWASWQRALRVEPGSGAARQALEAWESAAELPAAARTVYRFRAPQLEPRRARWDARLQGRDLDDLETAAAAFAALAGEDPDDAPARFNLALCLAWLGRNREALVHLDRVVESWAGQDYDRAVESWTLAEILRQGAGAEDQADDLRFTWILDWHEEETARLLAHVPALRRVPSPRDPHSGAPLVPEAQVFEWLDRPMPEPGPSPIAAADLPHVQATVVILPRSLRLSSPIFPTLGPACSALLEAVGDPSRPIRREATPLPLTLLDAAVWIFRIPPGLDPEAEQAIRRGAIEHYFENLWIHIPRHGLEGLSPLEASREARAGDIALRARLAAVVRIREQLGARPRVTGLYQGYPFDRLRRRLGLDPENPSTVDPDDPSCMGEADLDRLEPKDLDEHRLAEAYESALGLEDEARVARFAAELIRREDPSLAQLVDHEGPEVS